MLCAVVEDPLGELWADGWEELEFVDFCGVDVDEQTRGGGFPAIDRLLRVNGLGAGWGGHGPDEAGNRGDPEDRCGDHGGGCS